MPKPKRSGGLPGGHQPIEGSCEGPPPVGGGTLPRRAPKSDLHVVYDDELPRLYVIQCPEGWWRPHEAGYTASLAAAGTYPESQAVEIAKRRDGDLAVPLETAVRELVGEANPVVLAAIAALGGR